MRRILITSSSASFFPYYLDLVESLRASGIHDRTALGLLDLGLSGAQLALVESLGIRHVRARWMFEPPVGTQVGIGDLAFACRPYSRQLLPGYDLYSWFDADMWVQSDVFWQDLTEQAADGSLAVTQEMDPDYHALGTGARLWLFEKFRLSYGLRIALKLCTSPLINNGSAALLADAPHWKVWQLEFERIVARTRRVGAMDQLAQMSMLFQLGLPCRLLPATDNWVCSRAVPAWNEDLEAFVTPGSPNRAISVIYQTTPVRGRRFEIKYTDGRKAARTLSRPGGHVARLQPPAGPTTDPTAS